MQPALEQQVNNELEAVYFVDKVYRLDPLLYQKCVATRKVYKEFFASLAEIEVGNIVSPGEFTREQVLKKYAGHGIGERRRVFSRIKEVFKRSWFERVVYQPLPLSVRSGVEAFKKKHLAEFSHKTHSLPPDKLKPAILFAYFSASRKTDVLWVNAEGAGSEEEMLKILTRTITVAFPEETLPTRNLTELYTRLFICCQGVVIIENAPFLNQVKNRDAVYNIFRAAVLPPSAQLILIAAKEEPAPRSETPPKSRFSAGMLIYIAAFLITAAALIYTLQPPPPPEVKGGLLFRYFADEVEQDPFTSGVLLTWTDAGGAALATETIRYEDWHPIAKIPAGAHKLLLSKGSCEIHPGILPVSQFTADTLVVVLYKTIIVPDVSADSIIKKNAQRWYTFTLGDSARLLITCESNSDDLSPQIALFSDRLGRERIMGSDNILGDKKSVEINSTLPPGKYYLKVRGYDQSTGRYLLKIEHLPK